MRNRAAWLLTGVLAAAACPAAVVEPGLPAWKEGERAKMEEQGWIAGGILLTDDPIPDDSEKAEEPEIDIAQPTAEEMAEAGIPTQQIPEKFWPEYFGEKPKSFLVDPQGLLGVAGYRDRLAFLNYHASDSAIDLYVYVFKGDQEIPGEVREEELIERFFSEGRPAAVVYYFMSAPQLSVIYLSPSLTDSIPDAEQRRALESSVMQAFGKLEPSSQIEAFLVQMSIRIYWMERSMGMGAAAEEPMIASAIRSKASAKKTNLSDMLQPWIEKAKPLVLPASLLSASLLGGLVMTWWLRRRARYHLPEFDVEARLGGGHAAGVGAVISFASAAIPPASQRDQVPDYLRRY
jgi:hypothetical protein